MILHYYEKGHKENPVVIFIHGSASDASVWLNELNIIAAQGYYCLALDLRGHGETRLLQPGDNRIKVDIDSHIFDVVETLEHLGIFPGREIYMVTHSFGGIVAINLAEKYPKLVKKLMLVGLPPKLIFPISTMLNILLGKPYKILQANLDLFQASPFRARYKSSILTNAHVLQEIYKHVRRWNSFQKIRKLNSEIYFAAGRFDFVAPAWLIHRLHESKPESKFDLFKWSSHAVMEDEPEKFRDWLLDCLRVVSEPVLIEKPQKPALNRQEI